MKKMKYENKEKKTKKITKLFPWIISSVIALSPSIVKPDSQSFNHKLPLIEKNKIQRIQNVQKLNKTMDEDLYEWRKIWWGVVVDSEPVEYDSLRWAFKRNGAPLSDTSFTLTIDDTVYYCGVWADTVYEEPSNDFAWIVKFEYIEEPYESLQPKDPTADFIGDSVTTGTEWVHVTNIKYAIPGWVYIHTVQNTYYQQYDDGSLAEFTGTGVVFCLSPEKSKTYMADNTVYTLSVYLGIEDENNNENNKPMILDFSVYPNPTNAWFIVKLPKEMNGILTLIDMNGHVIEKKRINNTNEVKINVADIHSGNYRIVIHTNDETTKVSKNVIIIK